MPVRRIDGRNYHLYDAFPNKGMAKSNAKPIRADGGHARVIYNPAAGRLKWELWIHDPRIGLR